MEILSALQLRVAIQKRLENSPGLASVVCFDFFDTLVGRSVVPEDTKKIAANQLADLLGEGLTGDIIYRLRRVLEQRLCIKNRDNGLDPEFNLSHLAQKLFVLLKEITGELTFSTVNSFVDLMIDIELAVEKQVQTVNCEVVEILRYCRGRGFSTAIVSDFYLPAEYFQQFLLFHGLADLVDALFVSTDYGLTKGHSGRLYDVVREKLGCRPDAMIMVGDNVHADGEMAQKRGILSYCLKKNESMAEVERKTTEKNAYSGAEKAYSAVFSGLKNGYFPEMGLSLQYFIHNLFLQAVRDRHNTLFFCSKEGEFLRKLFMRYQEIRFGRQVIASRYLVVSRKATYICSCRSLDVEDFSRLFVHYRDLSLLEFLQSLNFSEAQALAFCEQLHLEPSKRHQDLKKHPDFLTLFSSKLFRSSYETHRHYQREKFLCYLESYGRDFLKEGIALVDVGWKGSIQNNIYHTLDGRVKVSGYYIGLLTPSELNENNEKKGILFADVPVHSPYIHVFNNNRSLIEMVLGASHGSADGYFSRDDWENLKLARRSSLFLGSEDEEHPYVTVRELPEEKQLFEGQILPLQQGYLLLFEKLTETMIQMNFSPPDVAWYARHHARMLFQPTRNEIDFFSRLYHLENYGLFQFSTFADTGNVPFVQRLANMLRLWKDPAGILETGVWPPIILRRLGLSWLQPVDGIKRYRRIFKEQR